MHTDVVLVVLDVLVEEREPLQHLPSVEVFVEERGQPEIAEGL